MFDEGAQVKKGGDVTDGGLLTKEEEKPMTIPNEADFLLAYSTVPGSF